MHETTSLFIFWIGLGFCVPLGIVLCRLYKPFMYVVFWLLVFSTAFSLWSISFESRETYRTVTRGFTINLSDLLCLVLGVSMLLRPREYRIRWLLPMTIPYYLYFFFALLAWVFVPSLPSGLVPPDMAVKYPSFELWLYPLFELSRLLWGGLLFWTAANFLNEERAMKTLVFAMASVLFYLFCRAVIDRYVFKAFRVSVSQFSINDFNLYVGMLGVFIFPFAFSSRRLWVSASIWLVQAMVLITILLTISRSSLAGYLLGVAVVTLVSLLRYPTARNLTFTMMASCVALLLLFKASHLLLMRFGSMESDLQFRGRLDEMAWLMVRDHPLGVGLGNYAAMAYGKYSALVGIPPLFIVGHNIWYLTLAETGVLGFIAFILIWVRYYQLSLVALWRSRDADIPYGFAAILGSLCATIPLQFQDVYHFAFRITSIYLIFLLMMGAMVGTYVTQKRIRRRRQI